MTKHTKITQAILLKTTKKAATESSRIRRLIRAHKVLKIPPQFDKPTATQLKITLPVDSKAPRPNPHRQTTGKLSLSSQASSAALMPHPLPSSHAIPQPPEHPSSLPGLKNQLARRVLSGDDSAGGVLILSRWKSALLQKFSLFERRQTRVREFLKRF